MVPILLSSLIKEHGLLCNRRCMAQGKAWTFTSFSYDDESFGLLCERASSESDLFVVQEEESPSTGRSHLQGFVRYPSNKRLNAVKTWLADDAAHCEIARGTAKHNLEYCTKSESATGMLKLSISVQFMLKDDLCNFFIP